MQGSSREAMAALREALTTDTSESDAQTLAQVSGELFAVVSLLTVNGSLRRALTDPAMSSDLKQRLVDNLLAEKVSAPTLALVRLAARSRWSEPRDLVDALEAVAVDAEIGRASCRERVWIPLVTGSLQKGGTSCVTG